MLLDFLERMILEEEWWRYVSVCGDRGLCVGKTYFEHKSLHKYTRVARCQDGVELKTKEHGRSGAGKEGYDALCAVRGMGRGLSDYHGVLCKVRLVGAWFKRRNVVDRARRTRSEKLREHQ